MPSKVAENVNFSRYTQRQSRLHTRYSYDTVGTEFGSQPQFEEFDYGVSNMSITHGEYYTQPPSYSSLFSSYPSNIWTSQPFENASTDNFADEPPLMEELGINFDSILQKTVTVLNPLTETNTSVLQEADLSGPFVFCLIFGTFLLFNGKLHFGYMYGIGMLGCLAMYALLNLMSDSSVSIGSTISVLGYCLMPMIVLSGLSILSLRGMTGTILSVVTVLWCSLSASKLFVTALDMDQQQLLIAYPCALLYGIFALLTVF